MKTKISIGLLIMIILVAFLSSATTAETSMDAFANDVIALQDQNDINTAWTANNIDSFIFLLKQYGLYERDGVAVEPTKWEFFSNGLRYAYEQAWGDYRKWDLEQQYTYAVLEEKTGIDDAPLESFPDVGDLTLEDARSLARLEIREMGDTKGYDGDAISFDAMIEQYHFWDYRDGNVGHTWVFAYYSEDINIPIYQVYLYDNGARPNVQYYDVNNMDNVYTRWRVERNQQTFFDWSVEDKYAFNETLLALYKYQMDTYGELTKTAKFVFQYRYVLPQEGMIAQDEAIALAKDALANQALLSQQSIREVRIGVFLFSTDKNQTVYGIGFAAGHTMQYMVEIDAYSASVLCIVN